MDRLRLVVFGLVALLAACGGAPRPKRLLNGEAAAAFAPIDDSVLTAARVVPRAAIGDRLTACLPPGEPPIAATALVVERTGVDSKSITFTGPKAGGVYACDGGVDPAGERRPPWCGTAFGERVEGRLLDPRLDVNCRDRDGKPVAYVFVEPVARAHWIGVDQGGYVELYEVLARLPVRVATSTGISLDDARADVDVAQFDAAGRLLVRGELEAAVAG